MSSLLADRKQGLFFVISAPAGTGKTTLVQMLVSEFSSVIESVSYTTREPRLGEIEGIHYHFVTEEAFSAKVESLDFLEHVTLYGYQYGTSWQWISEQQQAGKHVVLVIDTQGAQQIRGRFPATFIFIKPPSLVSLKQRLLQRGTETEETLNKRLMWATIEMEEARYYDYQIINDDLQTAYQILRSIIIAETHRTEK